jgi:peptide/nickel transport system ATP-binding protein
VSALDVSVPAPPLNLMSDLEREAGVTFLLISHDLAVVAHICETTAVMYRGRIVEIGETAAMFAQPAHPYTRELVDATPRLDRPTLVAPTRLERDALGSTHVAALRSPSKDGRSSERPLERGDAVNDRVYKSDSTRSRHALNGAPEGLEGCPYVSRCAFARPRCQEEAPALEAKGDGSRKVACHFPLD